MLQFVNLETGNIYDGNQPYIHWFPGQQSVGITYAMPICIIKDAKDGATHVELESNIFSLVNPDINSSTETINNISYNKLEDLKVGFINDRPANAIKKHRLRFTTIKVGENYYKIATIYIIATSQTAAEYIDTLYINGTPYKIGADFYDENESLYINLSNFGVEIPESIQKAIYPVNVHEENKDNIILNRKFKELLSNYWDVIANKGSYKSLLNSLKWFEWGDIVRVREIWKHEDFGKTIYDDRALCSVLEDKYKDSLSKFAKTTYISLYAAMQKLKKDNDNYLYDDEKNPMLEEISSIWSKEDLTLKMCLLGHFYETYFMPIHLDLIHSTIEDIVYTNTIKTSSGAAYEREDVWLNTMYDVECNVKDNNVFYLSNVSARVSQKTLFGNIWEPGKDYTNMGENILGVEFGTNVLENDDDLKTFYSQAYDGVGVIIPFICKVKLEPKDCIIREQIVTNTCGDWVTKINNDIFTRDSQGYTTIIFNLLCKQASDYEVRLQFDSAGGRIYTYNVKFIVEDISNMELKVYKIQHKDTPTVEDWYGGPANSYKFGRIKSDVINTYSQYIPAYLPTKNGEYPKDYKGVLLNNVLILHNENNKTQDFTKELSNDYFVTYKEIKDENGEVIDRYTIGVSKVFNFNPLSKSYYNKEYIYRNDYVYFPEFHELVEIGGDKLNDYIIYDEDALVVVPSISYKDSIKFSFGENIKDYEWEFENISTGEIIKLNNVSEPNIANIDKRYLTNGYYNIIFRYSLIDGEEHMLKLNSAFIKK